MKIRLLSEKDIRAVAPPLPDMVALVERAYRLDAEGQVEVPTKIGVHPDRENSFLHAMPAWVSGEGARSLGMKWVSYFPGNLKDGLPDSTGIIILNDPDVGLPRCLMEGMYITFVRTAACAAVAAKHLTARPPRSLGLIGCGGLGLWSLRALKATFPSIERVHVSSRTESSRQEFCAKMSPEARWTLAPVSDPLEAVRDSDIVVTSIPPGDLPPVPGDALAPGSILIPLDVVNSWQDDVLSRVDRVVSDNPANFSTQVENRRSAAFPALKPIGLIQDHVAERLPRSSASERTLLVVSGIASTDMVMGWEVYRRACAANVGSEFDLQG
jgi:ornithine cyclodeaminase/alanine dehydrogenase-like protein (mu-crystallin family)